LYSLIDSSAREKVNAIAVFVSKNNKNFGASILPKDSAEFFDSDSKTRIASIVKPMTSIAIMQLYEKGELQLDDPIQKYLTGFSGEYKNLITIRDVMSHTSGIAGYKNKQEKENTKNYSNLADAFKIFKDRPLLFEPGKAYSYTSYGYVVLGLIIEKVSGISYADYMQKNIWKEAQMKNTGFEIYGEVYKNKATLYQLNSKGEIQLAKANNLSDRIPGGGVYSTVDDLLAFGRAVLQNKLIRIETLKIMLKNPEIKKGGNGYGLGWTLYGEHPELGFLFGHGGTQTGASNLLMLLPDKQIVLVILSNTSGANQTVGELIPEILKLL